MLNIDGYPEGIVTKIVEIEITSKQVIGWMFKKWVVQGSVFVDGIEVGMMVRWQVTRREFKSFCVGERIDILSRWCGKFYTFSEFDLPNHQVIT